MIRIPGPGRRRLAVAVGTALVAVMGIVGLVEAPAATAAASPCGLSYMIRGQTVTTGQVYAGTTLYPEHNEVRNEPKNLISPNGAYLLQMQDDGNLVLYRGYFYGNYTCGLLTPQGWLYPEYTRFRKDSALWSTDTANQPGNRAVMQFDGNLVVYSRAGEARWSSGVSSGPSSYYRLYVQSDSNLVTYYYSTPLWSRLD
jgi:hypothetical protein